MSSTSTVSSPPPAPDVTQLPPLKRARRRGLRRWLREPLLHFLLLGTALFGAYAYLQPGGAPESSRQIVLTLDDLGQLEMLFESQWRRPPTPEEFSRLVEDKVQEEVLYREGLAMGLDKNDTIVRRRMAQKMRFLAEDVAAAHEPSIDELMAWFESNTDKFALPGRVSFRQLYFSPDRRGARAHDDAAKTLVALSGEPEDSKRAAVLADRFPFQEYYADRTSEQLAKDFGPQFAQAVVHLNPGSWQGPIESGFGWHLVFVDSSIAGRVPAFEEIEPEVKTAWLAAQKEQAWRTAYESMRAKYAVLLPVPPDAQSPPATAVPSPDDLPSQTDVAPE